MAAPRLRLELLGGFRVLTDSRFAARAPSARQQELVAFLILHARRAPVPRQRIAGSLWPESNDAQALTNLRRELHHLRDAWPGLEALIDVGSRTLAWRDDAEVPVDLVAFEQAAERGLAGHRAALHEAARLYQGDLLPDITVEWIETDREQLRQRVKGVLSRLISVLEQERAYGEAIEHAQQLSRLDPLEEQAWCTLMRCHARRGDRATALHLYQQWAAILKRELGAQPSAATRATYREILDLNEAPPSPAPPRTSVYPLVGRHAEFRTLLNAWSVAATGRPSLALIRGEAGIGKSRLAEELVDWSRLETITAVTARCYAGEGRLAYAPIASWLKSCRYRCGSPSRNRMISADDHIHLTRARKHDIGYLSWLQAEDLTLGNFLELQRQMHAAVQYGFGRTAEARRAGYTIRSGHESRNEFWGHINILGPERMIQPMSTGSMYANSPESYPFPSLLFAEGRKAGGVVGYAHFFERPVHSTIYMDAALGNIDFVEVFQFGVLKSKAWYELLNAGARVTGIAGSDFPVPLSRMKPWPHWLPLLGPERALVKAKPGENSYDAWARGVREGRAVVTNGPLVELEMSGKTATARASFYRPLETVEIVRNGVVVASGTGPVVTAAIDDSESCWVAARVRARSEKGEPELWGHTNPSYLLRDGRPVRVAADRQSVAAKWDAQLTAFRAAGIRFQDEAKRREFFDLAERALSELRRP
jgi:DNA-binding SARP family transcriptional activator